MYQFSPKSGGSIAMKTPTPMTPFDEATSSGLRMLKLFLPFLPPSTQNLFAVFIKFTELQNVLHQYSPSAFGTNRLSHNLSTENLFKNGDFSALKDFLPYLTPEEQQMFSMMKNMKEMLSVAELMSSFMDSGTSMPDDPIKKDAAESTSPKGENPCNNGNTSFDPASLLMGMLSPEQQNAFHTYSELFSQSLNSSSSNIQEEQINNGTMKGDLRNGKLDEPSCNENNRSSQTSANQDSSETDSGEIWK